LAGKHRQEDDTMFIIMMAIAGIGAWLIWKFVFNGGS
jgi:hypothetical protein